MIALPLEPWKLDARCSGGNVGHLFFAPDNERYAHRLVREMKAKAICAQCEVRGPCLESALAEPSTHGIWGGANEADRVRIWRERERRGLTRNLGLTCPDTSRHDLSSRMSS